MITTPNVPYRLEFSVEVPGTPEQVWQAIATAELDPPLCAEQPLERGFGLVRVDFFGEPSARTERQAEEFELVGRRPSAVGEQLEALLAHFRIGLVGEQFDPVVERTDRRHQVVTQA